MSWRLVVNPDLAKLPPMISAGTRVLGPNWSDGPSVRVGTLAGRGHVVPLAAELVVR